MCCLPYQKVQFRYNRQAIIRNNDGYVTNAYMRYSASMSY